MLLPSTVATAQHKVNLTVGSYNVRYDNEGDRKAGNGWDRRVPVLTSLIASIDYDVFGAQEVLSNQLDDRKKLLLAYDYVGVGRGENSAITWAKFIDVMVLLHSLNNRSYLK